MSTDGVLVFGTAGRLLHRNAEAARMLERDPERGTLEAEAARIARAVLMLPDDRGSAARAADLAPVRTVRTSTSVYRLGGGLLDPGVVARHACALVTVGRPARVALPSAEALRRRFDLTAQQTRVALLLAGRRTNREIADALVISPHTAKRHTEQVFLKLGVRSRRQVRAKLETG